MSNDAAPVAKASSKTIGHYFMVCDGKRIGPLTPRQMVDAGLTAGSFVWRSGLAAWTPANQIPELQPLVVRLPPPPPPLQPVITAPQPRVSPAQPSAVIRLIRSFGTLSLWQDVLLADGARLKTVLKQPTCWLILLLGSLPLVFYTVQDASTVITAFALFFSGVWALIFCYWIKGERVGWGWRIGTLLFTGFIGLAVAARIEQSFPSSSDQRAAPASLRACIGSIVEAGLPEEAVKAVPVVIVLLLLRRRLNSADIIVLAVFSGLGFAAYENVLYCQSQFADSIAKVTALNDAAAGGDAGQIDVATNQMTASMFLTMVLPLVRTLWTPFGHATWAAIFGSFLDRARRPEAKGRRTALIVTGLAVAAILHGTSDWLLNVQSLMPALVAIGSFLLLSVHLLDAEASMAGAEQTDVAKPAAASPSPTP